MKLLHLSVIKKPRVNACQAANNYFWGVGYAVNDVAEIDVNAGYRAEQQPCDLIAPVGLF